MSRLTIIMTFVLFYKVDYSQNIWVGLHLNKDREYKTVKPKIIREHNTYQYEGKSFINNNVKTLDRNGVLISEERYSEDGSKMLKLDYFFDSTDTLKTSLVFQRWTRGYEKMLFFYNYDLNKCLTSITQKDSTGKVIDCYEYVFNNKGYPLQVYLIGEKGDRILKESAIYIFDKNFASISLFTAGNYVYWTDTIKINDKVACNFPLAKEKYNSNCDIVSYSKFDSDGNELLFEKDYLYDSYGNRTEEKSYSISLDSNGIRIKNLFEDLKKEYIY